MYWAEIPVRFANCAARRWLIEAEPNVPKFANLESDCANLMYSFKRKAGSCALMVKVKLVTEIKLTGRRSRRGSKPNLG
jgi:hypothetical protein